MARLVSQRNREKFVHSGHLFTFAKFNHLRTIKFWRCDKRYSYGCKARLHTCVETNEVKKEVNAHTHGADEARVEVDAVCAALKRRAEETTEDPEVLLTEAYQGTSVEARERMPTKDAMRKRIQRRRAAVEASPPKPLELVASEAVPETKTTKR
uniref:FLYWCH-type domain-containing protein n=1 Tax=Trichuris muris TaxID=70415 RepID=A0A5S6QSI4_TRIMR